MNFSSSLNGALAADRERALRKTQVAASHASPPARRPAPTPRVLDCWPPPE